MNETGIQQTLLYVILCGIILVLGVMVAITCLLVHHNHHIRRLRHEARDNRRHSRRATHPNRTTPQRPTGTSKLDEEGYIPARPAPHPSKGPKYPSPQPPMYLTPLDKPYENVSLGSESGQSYESVGF